jgi:hypothetical protein
MKHEISNFHLYRFKVGYSYERKYVFQAVVTERQFIDCD